MKISSKNQITLPAHIRKEAHMKAGDEVDVFVYEGNVTMVKKRKGAAAGSFKHIKVNKKYSDNESLQSALKGKN